MAQQETSGLLALDHALESYSQEYKSYLEAHGLIESEESALRFLYEYENGLD